jgi:hypothetical protein
MGWLTLHKLAHFCFMEDEVWVNIPQHHAYQVSNFGRIRSLLTPARTPRIVPKILKSDHKAVRYPSVVMDGKTYRVHRLVASAFVQNPLNKPQVNHIDADKSNNRSDNLEWCTMGENNEHRNKYGLCLIGEKTPWSKLTNSQVSEIKKMLTEGVSCTKVAKIFGVKPQSIQGISCDRNWRHVKWPEGSHLDRGNYYEP